jgi:hypothetical protein
MGVMKDYYLTMEAIQGSYDRLAEDDDVAELHLYQPILRAAEDVLHADSQHPMPHALNLVHYALIGALADLEDMRKFWRDIRIR